MSRSRLRLADAWVAALTALVLLAACSASAQPSAAIRYADAAGPAPLPATTPYVVMTGAGSGWAVWRTGTVWLVLHTSDGFRHVANRTPIAVPTDGGLVASFDADAAAVAVAATERLTRSPLLTAAAGTTAWLPQELPSAVMNARGALAIGPGPSAVLTAPASGTLLVHRSAGWVPVTDATTLEGAATVRLDSFVWADRKLGWLTGHGAVGGPKLFMTTDGGASFTPIAVGGKSTVAALLPCGAGRAWALPVIDAHATVTVFRTVDAGTTWRPGAALRLPSGLPAWGCRGSDIWMVGRAGGRDRLLASSDSGQTWTDRGNVPTGLTDVTPTGHGNGFAASSGSHARLWTVSGDGARFRPVVLPSWVRSVGEQLGGD